MNFAEYDQKFGESYNEFIHQIWGQFDHWFLLKAHQPKKMFHNNRCL